MRCRNSRPPQTPTRRRQQAARRPRYFLLAAPGVLSAYARQVVSRPPVAARYSHTATGTDIPAAIAPYAVTFIVPFMAPTLATEGAAAATALRGRSAWGGITAQSPGWRGMSKDSRKSSEEEPPSPTNQSVSAKADTIYRHSLLNHHLTGCHDLSLRYSH